MDNSYQANLAAIAKFSRVAPLGSLREKIDPGHAALVVIDMQNDFCAHGGLVDKGGRDVSTVQEMARHLPALIESARNAGALIIFVRSVYTTDDNRYLSDVWLEQAARKQGGGYAQTPVCRDGSWEGDYYGDVRPLPSDIVVTKHRYNAFHKTDLDTILRANGIRTIVVTGVSTNVCIESTVREGFMNDYYIVLVRDGTAAYSNEEHEMTVRNIDRFFGEVSTIDELRGIWNGHNARRALAENRSSKT
jgi:ureidoacrylate peracid hydrolase